MVTIVKNKGGRIISKDVDQEFWKKEEKHLIADGWVLSKDTSKTNISKPSAPERPVRAEQTQAS